MEAISDPDLDAWADVETMENADKCAWQFGDIRTDALGRMSNVMVGNQPFLIQANWNPAADPATGYQIGCVINA